MGLFIDSKGLPITYELFPGNTNDCLTYRPNFSRIKQEYNLGRVITVADKGMTTGDNIWYTTQTSTKDGYVFSMSVRGADKELKKYVLNQDDYVWFSFMSDTASVTVCSTLLLIQFRIMSQLVIYNSSLSLKTSSRFLPLRITMPRVLYRLHQEQVLQH